jgi:hypothetical protein
VHGYRDIRDMMRHFLWPQLMRVVGALNRSVSLLFYLVGFPFLAHLCSLPSSRSRFPSASASKR